MNTKKNTTSEDFVRMYYEHQNDRVAKNEGYRLTITNYVLTVSALAFTFGFQNTTQFSVVNGIGLPLIIIIANIFAVSYIDRTIDIIAIHRNRAQEVLYKYAPELKKVDEKYKWNSNLLNSRRRIEKRIHQLLILIAFIPFVLFLYQTIWK